jgi:hypothetical protein
MEERLSGLKEATLTPLQRLPNCDEVFHNFPSLTPRDRTVSIQKLHGSCGSQLVEGNEMLLHSTLCSGESTVSCCFFGLKSSYGRFRSLVPCGHGEQNVVGILRMLSPLKSVQLEHEQRPNVSDAHQPLQEVPCQSSRLQREVVELHRRVRSMTPLLQASAARCVLHQLSDGFPGASDPESVRQTFCVNPLARSA